MGPKISRRGMIAGAATAAVFAPALRLSAASPLKIRRAAAAVRRAGP